MRKIECFKIRVLETSSDTMWEVGNMQPIHDISCQRYSTSWNPVVIVADPFLFSYNGCLYLFYEMKRNYSPGLICMTRTKDLKKWSKPVVVLEEPFHLSYPYVFEDGGQVYMIPETSAVGDIKLYKADNCDLDSFSYKQTLISHQLTDGEVGFADSSIFVHNGAYYLMTSIERDRINYLYLFTSDSLGGPFSIHPCSPICSSAKYGRNGGGLIKDNNGKMFRVAQDCQLRYGDNIHLLSVDKMTKDVYSEHLVKENLFSTSIPFYKEGGHQYNIINFNGRHIVATDAKEYHRFTLSRVLHKSISILLGEAR